MPSGKVRLNARVIEGPQVYAISATGARKEPGRQFVLGHSQPLCENKRMRVSARMRTTHVNGDNERTNNLEMKLG